MFTSIGITNFESGVLQEKMPVLLAYIRQDHEYRDQTAVLEGVSEEFGEGLKVCLLDENFIAGLRKLDIEGAPVFLIFHEGKEKARKLGKADHKTLSSFVTKSCNPSRV